MSTSKKKIKSLIYIEIENIHLRFKLECHVQEDVHGFIRESLQRAIARLLLKANVTAKDAIYGLLALVFFTKKVAITKKV